MGLKELLFGAPARSAGGGSDMFPGSIQAWLPVKNIIGGVVITKDNRFIKILEVLPVNIYLISPSDRRAITRELFRRCIPAQGTGKICDIFLLLPFFGCQLERQPVDKQALGSKHTDSLRETGTHTSVKRLHALLHIGIHA